MNSMRNQLPQELVRGVSYDDIVMDRLGNVSNQLYEIHDHMAVGMREIIQHMDITMRKKRRSLWSQELVCLGDGSLVVSNQYDDGSREEENFITNIRGPVLVLKVVPSSAENEAFFAITFETSKQAIVGMYNKLNATYLYDLFVKAGVKFNPRMTIGKIKDLIFKEFAPKITNPQGIREIPSNGGWYDSVFYSRENFIYSAVKNLADFPVMRKAFERIELTEEIWNEYFSEMLCVRNWRDRFLIMIFPFACMLSSLFEFSNKLILNIIPVGIPVTKRCCSWVQVFNRKTLSPVNGSLSEKEFEKKINFIKDEVFLLDCRTSENDTAYLKNKKKQNHLKAISLFSGEIDNHEGEIAAGLVTLSDDLIYNSNVRNIFISKESVKTADTPISGSCIGGVFGEFIGFVENHFEAVKHMIKRPGNYSDRKIEILSRTLDILTVFGQYENIDFLKRLNFREDFNVALALETEVIEVVDVVTDFVRVVREEAHCFAFSKKREARLMNDEIIYDENWLWISSRQLKEITKLHGLEKYMTEILYQLKKEHLLRTDGDGSLSRRLQCGKVRQERYQIARSLFDTIGCMSIVLLGKENEIDER